jgi:hypothetical protein
VASKVAFSLEPQADEASEAPSPKSMIHLLLQALQSPLVQGSIPLQEALIVFLHSLLMRTSQHHMQVLGARYKGQVCLYWLSESPDPSRWLQKPRLGICSSHLQVAQLLLETVGGE